MYGTLILPILLLIKFVDLLLPELLRNTQANLTDEKLLAGDLLGVRFNVSLVVHYDAALTTRGTAS